MTNRFEQIAARNRGSRVRDGVFAAMCAAVVALAFAMAASLFVPQMTARDGHPALHPRLRLAAHHQGVGSPGA